MCIILCWYITTSNVYVNKNKLLSSRIFAYIINMCTNKKMYSLKFQYRYQKFKHSWFKNISNENFTIYKKKYLKFKNSIEFSNVFIFKI